jgi:hypothetical protein
MNTTLYIDPILDTREAFNDRVSEIKLYFDFLNKILNGEVNINISPQLRYTLISVGYLVLYNLVESTSRSYLTLIHTSLVNERIAIEETTDLIKKVVIDGFRKYNPSEKFIKNLSDLRTQIMEECHDKDKCFSGNIDAKLLRKIALKYGFKIPKSCYGLLEVKTKRNDLAHGKVSFSECSKNEAEETIVIYKNHIIKYMTTMAASVEAFIKEKKYKKQLRT